MIVVGNAIAIALYVPNVRGVMTRLSGTVDESDIERWIAAVNFAFESIPDGTEVVVLSNLHGYEPASIDAHEKMRSVIPLHLAAGGLRTAMADLVDAELDVAAAPRITVSKVAHVHHDATKMANYEARLASPRERFFSDAAHAHVWLLFD